MKTVEFDGYIYPVDRDKPFTVRELVEVLRCLPPDLQDVQVHRVGNSGCLCCGPAIDVIVIRDADYYEEERQVILD